MLLRLAAFSVWGLMALACKTVDPSASLYSDDDLSPPEELVSGIYVVECSDGSQGYFTEQELKDEAAAERSCKQENLLIVLEDTTLEAQPKSAGPKLSCLLPARTILRLSAPLQVPLSPSSEVCTPGKTGKSPPLQACLEFHVQLAQDESQKLKSSSEPGASACKLSSGRLVGPMATSDEIEELRMQSADTGLGTPLDEIEGHTTDERRHSRRLPRFIFISAKLGFPRAASPPYYPGQQPNP